MQVAVFHPGTQHSRQTALALQQLGRLAFLATGLFDHPGSRIRRMTSALPGALSAPLRAELSRFASRGLDPAKVRAMARYELPERIASRLGATELAIRLDAALNAAFGRKVAGMAAREGPMVLWGYDGSSETAFEDPRAADCYKILDRTMADSRSWNEERERIAETHGDWLGKGSPAWGVNKIAMDDAEFTAADKIVCGSPFVMDTIRTYSQVEGVADKLELLPYGFDAALFGSDVEPAYLPEPEPLRFLFAGQVSARKGVQHVLEAFDKLPKGSARLTLLGQVAMPGHILARYRDTVDIVGAVPRAQVPAIMREHHALVFPSHNEGSALVLPEAMASGLAIIQTAAAGLGASDRSGFVLGRPDAGGVEEAMATLIANRDLLHSMRLAAIDEARLRNADSYRDSIAALLEKLGL
ncbi:MAG: glycosyltransferase family 4 protein [Erythrobacter sp.]|nr:glycosyltransferase family 4 protein [Erythrobacter sp.]